MPTNPEVAKARRDAEIAKIKRTQTFEAINDWAVFGASKLTGLTSLGIAAADGLGAHHILQTIPHGDSIALTLGVTLFGGKKVAGQVLKILNTFK